MRDTAAGAIPVGIVTGFLGSGKSTRVARLLRDPACARTAVIVNEFGEIGIDHHLVDAGDDRTVLLENGCLCCTVRDGLLATLLDLHARLEAGLVVFDRVIIETSGLADPAPILMMLGARGGLSGRYRRAGVVATVDALAGQETLSFAIEATRQIALADRIVLTKTDLAAPTPALLRLIGLINPEAAVDAGPLTPGDLFVEPASDARGLPFLAEEIAADTGRHSSGINAVGMMRDAPLSVALTALFLEGLSSLAGDRLLRVKAIVNVSESPENPMLVQGTRHRHFERTWLDAWPTADRRSRFALIGFGIPRRWPAALLDCLAEELLLTGALRAAQEHPAGGSP